MMKDLNVAFALDHSVFCKLLGRVGFFPRNTFPNFLNTFGVRDPFHKQLCSCSYCLCLGWWSCTIERFETWE